MDIKELVERSGFHDASVLYMKLENGIFVSKIENIILDLEGDEIYSAEMTVGITLAKTDDVEVKKMNIEYEGSSIIDFERSRDRIYFAIDWHSYNPFTVHTRTYELMYKTFDMKVEKTL